MWVEFVVGSRLVLRFFSGLSPSTKTNTLNSNSTRIEDPHGKADADLFLIYLFILRGQREIKLVLIWTK